MLDKKILLLIPESRKRPLTETLLYKQIVKFFEEEKISDKFEIAFITIHEGIVPADSFELLADRSNENERLKANSYKLKDRNLPPKHFRSGQSVISKEQVNHMANNIERYLTANNYKLKAPPIAYVRGSYLEATRLANEKLKANSYKLKAIQEIFSDDELAQLKKKGIMWMKVGLRMPTAFIVFRMKIKEIAKECKRESMQLKLPF